MKFSKLILLFSPLLATSCVSLQPPQPNPNRVPLTPTTLEKLNGSFEILPHPPEWPSLEYTLLMGDKYDMIKRPDSNDRIELRLLDERRMEVKMFDGEHLLRSKIRQGKLRDGYFYLKKQRKIPIFFVLLNGYSEMKTRVGLLENGNLTVDANGGGCALLVFFPIGCAGGQQDSGLEYRRVELPVSNF